MDMRARIDPLIEDRAGWLARPGWPARFARHALDRLLGYPETLRVAAALADLPAERVLTALGRLIARRVTVSGLHHVPARGRALIVANHPTGIADGVVLWHVLSRARGDVFAFANADVLRVLPQLETHIAPVEWRVERRSHAKTRATLRFAQQALAADKLGVIFPSGRLARRDGLRLRERPWKPSAAILARRFDLPVIPVHVAARNSALFYLFDALHPSLRDITLFHETLNKRHQAFHVTIGAPIPPGRLPPCPDLATQALRDATLRLGEADRSGLPLMRPFGAGSPVGLRASGWT